MSSKTFRFLQCGLCFKSSSPLVIISFSSHSVVNNNDKPMALKSLEITPKSGLFNAGRTLFESEINGINSMATNSNWLVVGIINSQGRLCC